MTGVLLVQCPDQKGVVAALAQLLFGFNCNILQSDQFSDETAAPGRFFQRIHFDYSDISVGAGNLGVLETAVGELAKRYQMDWQVGRAWAVGPAGAGSWGAAATSSRRSCAAAYSAAGAPAAAAARALTPTPRHAARGRTARLQVSYRTQRKRVAVLVSKMDHCLYDLLIRQRSGELHCDIPLVVSNHGDLGHVARMFGVDFEHLGFSRELDRGAAKQQQEAALQRVRAGSAAAAGCGRSAGAGHWQLTRTAAAWAGCRLSLTSVLRRVLACVAGAG